MAVTVKIILFIVFFVSGGLGTLYQVLWGKFLENFIGLTAYAYAAVLSAFIGGLALGSRLLSPWADRRNPLRVYAFLEGCVGIYALLYPYVSSAVLHFIVRAFPSLSL
ncbi:MAG: spermidine synthase, partial [Acidobacteria bacterium]|nr:spermidine synthase [Acidobacteriota bacterium]MDW7985317.1 spermidine synthase [Acidobacteriota bacterium]